MDQGRSRPTSSSASRGVGRTVIFSARRTKEEARGRRRALLVEGENGVRRQETETAKVTVQSLPLSQLYKDRWSHRSGIENSQTMVVSNPARTRATNGRMTGSMSQHIKWACPLRGKTRRAPSRMLPRKVRPLPFHQSNQKEASSASGNPPRKENSEPEVVFCLGTSF